MSELEEKLGTLLSNPQLMQQIAAMAQSLGQPEPRQPEPRQPTPDPQPTASLPDPALLQSLSAVMQTGRVDDQQRALLRALAPFLSQPRIRKLERAMRAAKLADTASALLKNGNLFGGR